MPIINPLPIALPEPGISDPIGKSGLIIKNHLEGIYQEIARALTIAVEAVAQNSRHSRADFWTRQGTNGVAILNEMSFWITFLEQRASHLLTPLILSAGQGLTPHADGRVTVDEPTPPPTEPEV